MPKTKRAQILMEPKDYQELERIAGAKHVSVGELIREAVTERYLVAKDRRRSAAERICRMDIPLDDWETLEKEIEDAHGESVC